MLTGSKSGQKFVTRCYHDNGSLSSINFGELIRRGMVVLVLQAFLGNGNTLMSKYGRPAREYVDVEVPRYWVCRPTLLGNDESYLCICGETQDARKNRNGEPTCVS